MTPEQRADEIIAKYGMPRTRDLLHAMLAFAIQQGKTDGAAEVKNAISEMIARPASSATSKHVP